MKVIVCDRCKEQTKDNEFTLYSSKRGEKVHAFELCRKCTEGLADWLKDGAGGWSLKI